MKRLCAACGHPRRAHQHYGRRDDTRCGLCECTRYQHPWPWRRRATRKPPAPADTPALGNNPVPGQTTRRPPVTSSSPAGTGGNAPAPVPAREPRSPVAAPAPALPRRHGGISYSIRVWECGRIRMWDGAGTVTWAQDCKCPSGADWHEWERELTS